MRTQDLALLLVGEACRNPTGAAERIVEHREPVDEWRPTLEEVNELPDRQLPR